MASNLKARESGKALAIDSRFSLPNLKSHGPSSVQAKGFRAKIMTLEIIIVELHRIMKEEDKTGDIGGSRFES